MDHTEPDNKQVSYAPGQVLGALLWSSGGQVITQVITLLVGVLLARLLLPEDYGIFATVAICTTLTSIFANLGTQPSVLRHEQLDDDLLGTLLAMNMITATGFAALLFLLAEPISSLFDIDEVAQVLRIAPLSVLFNGAAALPGAILVRQMNQRALVRADIFGIAVYSATALLLAAFGGHYWGLVAGVIAQAFVSMYFKWIGVGRWIRPRLDFVLVRREYLFGLQIGFNDMLVWASGRVDYMLGSRLLGATLLGYYVFGFNLAWMPSQKVQLAVRPVIQALLAEAIRKRDDAWVRYVRLMKYLVLATWFVLAGLFIVAPQLISVVYGDKWMDSVDALRIIIIAAAVSSISSQSPSIYALVGRPNILTMLITLRIILIIAFIFILVQYDLVGFAMAFTLAFSIATLVDQVLLSYVLDGQLSMLGHALLPAFFCTAGTLLVAVLFDSFVFSQIDSQLLHLMGAGLLSVASYAGILVVFFPAEWHETTDWIGTMFARRMARFRLGKSSSS